MTKKIYRASAEWWQIRQDDFTLGENAVGNWLIAAEAAGVDVDDPESWVCEVRAVAEEHTAIEPGDYACCQGIGSPVIFVRVGKSASMA